MNEYYSKLIEKIKSHADPNEAVKIALEVVTSYLEQRQSEPAPSADPFQARSQTSASD